MDAPLLGEGREAEIFAWGEGRVLRLNRSPDHRERVEQQALTLAAAARAGVPVPAVDELVTVEGRPGLVMEHIDGGDPLSELGRRPWRLLAVAAQLGRLQAELHEVEAPAELPALRELLGQRIADAPHLSADAKEFLRGRLADRPDGERICHGDFHPGNVMMAARGPVIIDWTNAARGDPTGDLARTQLMLKLGRVPGEMSALAKVAEGLGRGLFRALWMRAYRRARPIDAGEVDRWLVVCAGARLAEEIPEEVPDLLALLKKAGCPP